MNDEIMRQAGFGEEVRKTKLGMCPFCSKPVNMEDFRDDLSRKEFTISGLCQQCQDDFFE